jgi:hypothetical protein
LDDTITTIFCLCDDFFLKANNRFDDPQVRLTTAEVMSVPLLVAAIFFGANIDKTCRFLREYGVWLHAQDDQQGPLQPSAARHRSRPLARALFAVSRVFQKGKLRTNLRGGLFAGSAVCENIRIRRCRLYPLEEHGGAFRGYIPSKRRYFYGLRVHLVVTGAGEPVEFSLAKGSEADITVFEELELDLPEGSIICADKAYTDYHYEDLLKEVGLYLKAQRRKNSKRPMAGWEEFLSKPIGKYIETVFSGITNLFSKKIHALTPRGFELKIVWFLLAFAIQCL